jgi:SagB-type dehydrogenase family enzyme
MTKDIGHEFLIQSRHKSVPLSPQKQGFPQPPLELKYSVTEPLINLPEPKNLIFPAIDIRDAIERRKSVRTYVDKPLELTELTLLLWLTQGVKQVTDRPATQRNVPSAGARHPFETYLLINKVKGLTPGLYRYIALEHALIGFSLVPDLNENITKACLSQKHVQNSAVTFFWAAVTERMEWRYPRRGIRYLFMDAGHVCQNLYLAAESINCGVCAIGAFDDDLLNSILGLDGEELFTAYGATVGKKG